jgi:hypothetical protein
MPISAKKAEWDRSVLYELTHMEGAILYTLMLRGLVLSGYELGVGL